MKPQRGKIWQNILKICMGKVMMRESVCCLGTIFVLEDLWQNSNWTDKRDDDKQNIGIAGQLYAGQMGWPDFLFFNSSLRNIWMWEKKFYCILIDLKEVLDKWLEFIYCAYIRLKLSCLSICNLQFSKLLHHRVTIFNQGISNGLI